jgi:hypothetical protein
MIVSASRRTNIPAFYAEWMVSRLRKGYCPVANPHNRNQVTVISLRPEDVDALGLRIDVSRTIIAIESIKLASHAEDA